MVELLYDNRGVSPVIGTILMVAITVILTSVIGAALFMQAEDLTKTKPLVTFDGETENKTLTILHAGGDSLNRNNIQIITSDTGVVNQDFEDPIEAGDEAKITNLSENETVAIVWTKKDYGYIIYKTTVY